MSPGAATATLSAAATHVRYEIAATRRDREAAFQLVYCSYCRCGLGTANRYGTRVTPYQLLPTTQIFVAKLRGQVIATISLIMDGELGIPLQDFFPDQIQEARNDGIRLAEVSCFADRRRSLKRFLTVFCRLTRVMAQYARSHGVDQLVAGARPRHARFYQRYLGFESMGSFCYPAVEDIPALGMRLDFARADVEQPEGYQAIFGSPIPARELQTQTIKGPELDHFARYVQPSNRRDHCNVVTA